jgi:hypothetical protein
MVGGAAAKRRLCKFTILGLVLAGLLGFGALRVGVAAHRGAALPPPRALVVDHASEIEGSVSARPAPDRPGLPPEARARSRVCLPTVLDALQSVRRSSVTHISLPPPSPA